jgi:uncharacterized protein YprB with RNaseH-like and TPR domain
MQVEAADYMRLAEKAGTVLFFDLETQGLTADYGKILVYSRKFNDGPMRTTFGESKILRAMRADFDKADLVVGYNSRLFDATYANTRLLEVGQKPLPKKHHLDMYFALKAKLRLTSKAMGSIATLLGLKEGKMRIAPKEWRNKNTPVLAERCESDVRVLENIYKKTKHLVVSINR